MSETEEWRAVAGWEGLYEVSSLGRVRSVRRVVDNGRGGKGSRRTIRERIRRLRQPTKTCAYQTVSLWRDNEESTELVHRLVAAAFHGHRFGMECNHVDGVKTNNSASNLCWVTRCENIRHSVDVLGNNRGESSGSSRLTDEQVSDIRRAYRDGRGSLAMIASCYGVSACTVYDIVRRKTWRHIA